MTPARYQRAGVNFERLMVSGCKAGVKPEVHRTPETRKALKNRLGEMAEWPKAPDC